MKKNVLIMIMSLIIITNLFATISQGEKELGNAKKLLYETARIIESKNNLIVVDEISDYDWFWKNDPKLTTPYINQFNETLKDNRLINKKRERLQYMYEQNKSMAVATLVPNALHMVNIAINARDPLKAIIAVGGAALSSYASYTTAKQQAELQLIQEQWKLDDQQVDIFEQLQENLRTYLSETCFKYNYENEDLTSPQTIKSFLRECNKYDFSNINDEILQAELAREYYAKINIIQYKNELSIFPEYWAEIAKAAYFFGDYNEALKAISNYEKHYIQTMYHDNLYAYMMEIKAYCILDRIKAHRGDPATLEKVVDDILRMSTNLDWAKKYFCVELYKDLYLLTQEKNLLIKCISLFNEVLDTVADNYKTDLDNYISGKFIKNMLEGIDEDIKRTDSIRQDTINTLSEGAPVLGRNKIGSEEVKNLKAEKKELKGKINELKKRKKEVEAFEYQILPPSNSLLFALTKEYIDLNHQTNQINSIQYNLILNKAQNLLTDTYSQKQLFLGENTPRIINAEFKKEFPKSNYYLLIPYVREYVLIKNLVTKKTDNITFKVPISYFNFASETFDIEKDIIALKISSINSKNEYTYQPKAYLYEVVRGQSKNSLEGSYIKFIMPIIIPDDETGLSNSDFSFELIINSDSMQDSDPIYINMENKKELLKNFKLEDNSL